MTDGLEVHNWTLDSDGNVYLSGKLYVPATCREEVLKEFHKSRFTVYLESTKMYRDLGRQFRWPGVIQDVIGFVSHYLIC